ncbi:MAG: hypothetical protein EAZ36_04785 [Verrucomicrobia bacterium]|nr:MAG: hypothetical protein EAZ36_04785 [Verrucomicrobiota bacterium]
MLAAPRLAPLLKATPRLPFRMPNLPTSLFVMGAGLLGARTARLMQPRGWALAAQAKHQRRLSRALAKTSYGRAQGIEAGMSDAAWREKVPLRTYQGFLPYIDRMMAGETSVLWPGRCSYFAVSSDTTAGQIEYLPVTDALLAHFRWAGLDSLFYYSNRVGRSSVFGGKHLLSGGGTPLVPVPENTLYQASAGDISGITERNIPGWMQRLLYEPGREIAEISDWPTKIRAIAARCAGRDIRMLAGIPSWILIMASALLEEGARMRSGRRPATLRELWPNFECLVHGGVPVAPFLPELRSICGPGVNFHEVYPVSEGFIAAQDAEPEAGLRLMADAGIFYEFIPLTDYNEELVAALGRRTVPLEGVRVGVDYVLIMSTPGGLTRYVMGDVVRFLSAEPPRLIYTGRIKRQLSTFGEQVIEKELTDALTSVCTQHGWRVVNFHVAPVFVSSIIGQTRGNHEWWIELRPGTHLTPRGPLMASELDLALQRLNESYAAKRGGGGLLPPTVRLVMPGLFEQWQRSVGRWGGQNRVPRCRGDRKIAEELAKISRFHDSV